MARVWVNVPAESDLLCEGCGYVLNGLPDGANCPECGKPATESAPELRGKPAWEMTSPKNPAIRGFLKTTWVLLTSPAAFYRTFTTRQSRTSSRWFGRIHCAIAAILFGAAAFAHFNWYLSLANSRYRLGALEWIALTIGTYGFLVGTIAIAARLTYFEASYRGYRLPLSVVRRGLDYHAAHYLPVAAITAVTVLGHQFLLRRGILSILSDPAYLYTLSAEVLLAAYYLFKTYWTAMRNMMYANA